jgi:uncharacterized membrane protein YtjA (UPF0391 family)
MRGRPLDRWRHVASRLAGALLARSMVYDHHKGPAVIKWALIFFIISLIAGAFGFTGAASAARTVAKVLFVIALIIFLVVLIFGVFMGTLVF